MSKVFEVPHASISGYSFTAKRYRFESLDRFTEKAENARVVGEYKEALRLLSDVSLNVAGGCAAYAALVYHKIGVLVRELISENRRRRRFARFRATKRNLHHMATTIAYGAEKRRFVISGAKRSAI